MMKRRFWCGAWVVVLCATSVLACRARQPDHQGSVVTLRLLTGPATGSFGPLGRALVRSFDQHSPDLRLVARETAGSVPNVEALHAGTGDLGLAQAGVAYMAYNGHLPDTTQHFRDLRGVAVLHPSYVHLLVSSAANIASLAELKGKHVGLGPVGTNGAVTSVIARGLYSPGEVQFRNLPVNKTADALANRDVDAVFITSGIAGEEINRAIATGAHLVDIHGAAADRLRANYPFLKARVIPANAYAGQTTAVRTLAVDILLVARAGLDEAIVRRVTATLFDALPQLSREVSFLRSMSIERASATPIPLHSGAALYYRERELGR
jgi:TRAP transporter TAXI family solute receptor